MRPDSRESLIKYALRALGEPVAEVNVDDDQIEDRLDQALQYYQEYHSDAVERGFFKIQITEDDVANKYLTIPDSIISVSRVMPVKRHNTSVNELFDIGLMMEKDVVFNMSNRINSFGISLSDLEAQRQYLTLLNQMFDGNAQRVQFVRHASRLKLELDWNTIVVGDYVLIEGSMLIDPEEVTTIYNDMMLKKYFTALLKLQWGMNLFKYEGMQLPGGVTVSGKELYASAQAELEKLETEFQDRYSFPPEMFVG